jgi:hypothetical protein
MDLVELTVLVLLLMVSSFVLGAAAMWSLESKRPRRQPLWLVLAGHVAFIGFAAFTFITNEAPRGVVTIDPAWWTAMGIVTIAAGVLAVMLQVRQYVRSDGDEPA